MLEPPSWRRWTTAEEDEGGEAKETVPEADTLEDPMAVKEREAKELTDTLKRVQAEFENYKKRMDREWTERSRLACEKIVSDLLPILDTFDEAIENAGNNGDAASLRKGLESIYRQLLQTLHREGLKEIDTKGKLDPFRHESLMRVEQPDAEDGVILEVFQKGYMLGPKVIRTAKVKVAKKPEIHDDDNLVKANEKQQE